MLRLSKPNPWFQKTNSFNGYLAGLFFMSFDVRFLFYFVWNLTFNNLNSISKIWCPKTDIINSSTCGWPLSSETDVINSSSCGWPLALKTDVINSTICNWWSEAAADGLRSIYLFQFVLPSLLREYREQHA